MNIEELFWLYLNNIPDLSASVFAQLYYKYQQRDAFLKALTEGEIKLDEIYKRELLCDEWLVRVNKTVKYMEKRNISVTFYHMRNYPYRLKTIDYAPPILYYIGDISITDMDSVAIVGSRVSTSYGKKCAKTFGNELAENDICIISGMADGIDSYAHWAALEVGGKTIAVLGGGVDNIYPQTNAELYYEIAKSGLLVSEYPLASKPQRNHFPERNRIITGLADCLVVAEAGLPSGTMSTVDCALDQGKNVYAIPGSIHSASSAGTNYLIKCGSLCAIDPSDVLVEFGFYQLDDEQGAIPDDESFDDVDRNILKLLTIEPLTAEELEEALNIDPFQLNTALSMLEISDYISKDDERRYTINKGR